MVDTPTHAAPPTYQGSNYQPRQGTSGMAIAGFVLAFFGVLDIVGLILSIIAFRAAKRENRPRGLALAGIIIAAVTIVLAIVGGIVAGVALGHVASECKQLGPGTHHVNGVTYTCS
ncbi:hypothetical protein AX769_04325 [Frondihabitans sp. PAMC 28766]|uniref:DUF4190 domain-containing protein n=1 Tax=Frondihabitans sp. PAMC 28766 TaxID=1795630 RepID=UPI00078D183B|nr:DUF4190 domain-containing protein [Frondihabitans sp. PAMC 28766]AMM19508.1 hypothetical protein AX769_04325 [Frondihabitans sp. PAMC 28766]